MPAAITPFAFRPGRKLAGKYEVIALLGRGWEGEVYRVREIATGIDRAAKFFYPERNKGDRTMAWYAKKLDRLRQCDMLISYLTHDQIQYQRHTVKFLVSEYVAGEVLEDFLAKQPQKRLGVFTALHVLYSLVSGMEQVHQLRDYHGDLHLRNIIVKRHGIGFQLKLIDVYRWHGSARENIQADVCDLVRVFYDLVGGQRHYAKQPQVVKDICCGLKRTLILKKFRTAGDLRAYLEMLEWE